MRRDRRRLASKVIWGAFACFYAVSLIGAGYVGSAFPLLTTVPLAAATALFASVFWPRQRRAVLIALAAAVAHGALSVVLVSDATRRSAPLDGAAGTTLWVVALFLPIAATVHAFLVLRRDTAVSSSSV